MKPQSVNLAKAFLAPFAMLSIGRNVSVREMPGFGPAAEVLLVWQKDPKPWTPSPASPDWMDATHGEADQLAALRQGQPVNESVHAKGRSAGAGHGEKEGAGEIFRKQINRNENS